jgi:peptide/nickel transport system substrate-binding protein
MLKVLQYVSIVFILVIVSCLSAAVPVYAAPSITSINPDNGPYQTAVTVKGAGFDAGDAVTIYFDSQDMVDFTLTSTATSFSKTFTIPSTNKGSHTIYASGSSSGETALTDFTVEPSITVNSTSGSPGDYLTVYGYGFSASESNIKVTFNGTAVGSIKTASTIGYWTNTITVPSLASGTYDIGAYGNSTSASEVDTKSYQLIVDSFISLSKNSGSVGTLVIINGSGFAPNESGVRVTFGGLIVGTTPGVTVNGTWSTIFNIPAAPTGSYVVDAYGNTTSASSIPDLSFTIIPQFSITPVSGIIGTLVTASGTGYGANEIIIVTFDDVPVGASIANNNGSWSTTFSIPISSSGPHKIGAGSEVFPITFTTNPSTLSITTEVLRDGDAKAPYLEELNVVSGTGPYKWTVKKGSRLPSGLTLKTNKADTSTAFLSGKPAKNDTFSFTLQVRDNTGTLAEKAFTLLINKSVTISAPRFPTAEVGDLFPAWSPTATGGNGIYTWSINILPSGLNFDPSNGKLSGIPQASDTFPITLTVTDTLGGSAAKRLSLKVLEPLSITTWELPSGDIGIAYKCPALKASGGTGHYTWNLSEYRPPGLNLVKNKIIGVPTVTGSYYVVIRVDDGIGQHGCPMSIEIHDLPVVSEESMEDGSLNTFYEHQLHAANGTGTYTWSLVSVKGFALPPGLKLSKTGLISGTVSKKALIGIYYFRVRVKDNVGGTSTRDLSITLSQSNKPVRGGILKFIAPTGNITPGGFPADLTTDSSPVYESLVVQELNGDYSPSLATAWEISPDRKSVTFHLRKGVKFHDGSDFNAAAVKFNFDAQIAAKKATNWASTELIDDYTIKVNITRWTSTTLVSFSDISNTSGIASRVAYEKHGIDWLRQNPVGTGPFKFLSFTPNQSYKLVRNPKYWQAEKPYLDGLETIIIPDATMQKAAMQVGDGDATACDMGKQAYEYRKWGLEVVSCVQSVFCLIPDTANRDSPWSKQEVREAAEYAIDKEAMAAAFGYGLWKAPYQVVARGWGPYMDSYSGGRIYDPAKAKYLLAKAGYLNGFETTMFLFSDATSEDKAQVIQAYFATVGIKCDIQYLDYDTYISIREGGWSNGIFLDPVPAYANYMQTLSLLFAPTGWIKYKSWDRTPEYTNAYHTANSSLNADNALIKNVTDLMYDKAMIIPVYEGGQSYACWPYVKDAGFLTRGLPSLWNMQNVWMARH